MLLGASRSFSTAFSFKAQHSSPCFFLPGESWSALDPGPEFSVTVQYGLRVLGGSPRLPGTLLDWASSSPLN